jgi:hypothetical protein
VFPRSPFMDAFSVAGDLEVMAGAVRIEVQDTASCLDSSLLGKVLRIRTTDGYRFKSLISPMQ